MSSISDLKTKYLFSDLSDLAHRVSSHIAGNEPICERERWQQSFYNVISSMEFMPSGNTLSGSGTEKTLQPNCSVIGEINDENREEIIERSRKLWEKAVGVGFYLNTKDPVATLQELSLINDSIKLWENRPKRGNMAVISIEHPRFHEIASYKSKNLDHIYNFNISVAITDEFMNALNSNDKWKETDKTPSEWLTFISQCAWRCGDPGVVFIDRVQGSPEASAELGRIKTAVPCGEQFLFDNETCNLGVVNLNAPTLFDERTNSVNWERLEFVVSVAIRFLDNVVDLLEIPDEIMKDLTRKCRRVGLGIAGWADLLSKSNISYNCQDALDLANDISLFITEKAKKTSAQLAQEKGECPFRKGYRNISLTCVQPTGGVTSLLGNKGYSIEPFFSEANQLTFSEHIQMQAVWQRNIEQGISKTINMPNLATVNDVFNAYVLAFNSGCKGITIYRDDCRLFQPIKCKACEEEDYCPKL